MSGSEWVLEEMKTPNNLIAIRINWNDVKGNRIEFEYTEILDTAWIYIMNDEDYILQMWEIQFNRE